MSRAKVMPRQSVHGLTREGSRVVRLRLPNEIFDALAPYPVEQRNLLLRTVIDALTRANPTTLDEVQVFATQLRADLNHLVETGAPPPGSYLIPEPRKEPA